MQRFNIITLHRAQSELATQVDDDMREIHIPSFSVIAYYTLTSAAFDKGAARFAGCTKVLLDGGHSTIVTENPDEIYALLQGPATRRAPYFGGTLS